MTTGKENENEESQPSSYKMPTEKLTSRVSERLVRLLDGLFEVMQLVEDPSIGLSKGERRRNDQDASKEVEEGYIDSPNSCPP